jgi:hypothetical protein
MRKCSSRGSSLRKAELMGISHYAILRVVLPAGQSASAHSCQPSHRARVAIGVRFYLGVLPYRHGTNWIANSLYSKRRRVCVMYPQMQWPANLFEEVDGRNRFKVDGVRLRVNAFRAPRELSGFVSHLSAPDAGGKVSNTIDGPARNIANWSSYLPADCIKVMVSLGWDRST